MTEGEDMSDEDCRHDSSTGDEGPGVRHVVRWRCDGCGAIHYSDGALASLRAETTTGHFPSDAVRAWAEQIAMVRENGQQVTWSKRLIPQAKESHDDMLRALLAWHRANPVKIAPE